MQFEWMGLIVKVKTHNFYMNCHVVYLKLIAVVDHKLLTSGTNLVNLMKEIWIQFEVLTAVLCKRVFWDVSLSVCDEWVLTFRTNV